MMRTERTIAEFMARETAEGEPVLLNGLILHNEETLAERGVELTSSLEEGEAAFFRSTRVFDLEQLDDEVENSLAGNEAAAADIVFVGVNSHRPLPVDWRIWFWKWAKARNEAPGVLVLVEPGNRPPDPKLREFFSDLAVIGGMTLVLSSSTADPVPRDAGSPA